MLLTGSLLLLAAPLAAQTQPPAAPADSARQASPEQPKLMFEREVYSYPGAAGRRDPFLPLVGQNNAGPLFQDLQLRMILYSAEAPARSVASLLDATENVPGPAGQCGWQRHRARRWGTPGTVFGGGFRHP